MKLSGRTILITGGTSGIGLEFANQLLARGNTVIVTGRDKEKIEALRASHPNIHAIQSDVSSASAIVALHEQVISRFPALDTLINNAGIMRNLRLQDTRDLDDVTREIDTNLSGPVRMIQQFLPHLQAQRSSLIVNVSSGLAFVPWAIAPVYCAAKAALHSFTESLRFQLQGTSVTVVELAPPPVETPLLRRGFEEETKGQKGMDVAVLIKHAMAGIEADKPEIRPGLSNVLKLMSRIAPAMIFKQLAKSAQASADPKRLKAGA